jgi:hypothetical protein
MQVVQAVEAVSPVAVPDSHSVHVELPSTLLYVPGSQAAQELDFSPENLPLVHTSHEPELAAE